MITAWIVLSALILGSLILGAFASYWDDKRLQREEDAAEAAEDFEAWEVEWRDFVVAESKGLTFWQRYWASFIGAMRRD